MKLFYRYCFYFYEQDYHQIFADTVLHDVLHIYSPIRRETFRYADGQWNKNPDARKNWYTKIPEGFDETGYRGNFRQVYSKLTGVGE